MKHIAQSLLATLCLFALVLFSVETRAEAPVPQARNYPPQYQNVVDCLADLSPLSQYCDTVNLSATENRLFEALAAVAPKTASLSRQQMLVEAYSEVESYLETFCQNTIEINYAAGLTLAYTRLVEKYTIKALVESIDDDARRRSFQQYIDNELLPFQRKYEKLADEITQSLYWGGTAMDGIILSNEDEIATAFCQMLLALQSSKHMAPLDDEEKHRAEMSEIFMETLAAFVNEFRPEKEDDELSRYSFRGFDEDTKRLGAEILAAFKHFIAASDSILPECFPSQDKAKLTTILQRLKSQLCIADFRTFD